jgi:O-methyltransferase involved in polyketide biosynthesis
VDMAERLDCDFSQLIMHRHDQIAVIMRMKKFDDHTRDFLTRHPNGTIVHIGCGLDTRFERVDNGRVEWFDLDMPDVIALRRKLLSTDNERYHMLAASAFENDWMESVERFKTRPFLFMAEGVFPYFEEAQIKSLFLRLQEHFPGAEVVCDAHTPFVVWADNIHLALTKVKARLHWSIKTGRDPESWGEGIKMLDEWNYYDTDDPGLEAFRWIRIVPGLAKSSGIFHYQLGSPVAETV